MAKLRDSARMQPCTLRLQGCTHDPATTVLAHLPCAAKGMGIKGPDWFAVYACASCHDVLDGRKGGGIMRVEKFEAMLRGLYETQSEMIRLGLIKME